MAAKNLVDRDPLLSVTADKLGARSYIAKQVGEEHLVPLLQWSSSAAGIDFDRLRAPCVIKATHGCDMTILIRKGDRIDKAAIIRTVNKWIRTDFSRQWKEWVYSGVPRGVVVEEFLGDGSEPPNDYKFFMFNGKVGMIQVDEDRFVDHRTNMLDDKWNALEVKGVYGPSDVTPEPPPNLAQMVEIAEKLASNFQFVRIDLYNVDGRVYVGEITHYTGGGKLIFTPREFDRAVGDLWRFGTPIPDRFKRLQSV